MRVINPDVYNLDDAIAVLKAYKERNCPAKMEFNGEWLTTEMSDDEIYLAVTSYTKDGYQEMLEQKAKEYERQQEEHKARIPELTEQWIKWGEENLSTNVQEDWKKCVPIRLNDLYQGWELNCFKEIVDAYKENKSKEEIKEIMDKQGHSGMSHHLECSIVYSFLDKDLGEYLNKV